jgi:hypothetical protein
MTLHCILCGADAAIKLDLADGETLTCPECGDDFAIADVQERVDQWSKALKWIATMPKD